MKIASAVIYALKIPFVESFSHATQTRGYSDSIIVQVIAENGVSGFGEGIARPYVTGETVDSCLLYMRDSLWPAIIGLNFPRISSGPDPIAAFSFIDRALSGDNSEQVIAWNACKAAFESAIIDCLLKQESLSLSTILPPKRSSVVYSGVITSGPLDTVVKIARRLKQFDIKQVKVKVDGKNDHDRVAAVREIMGQEASIRIDANGAFTPPQAVEVVHGLSDLRIDCVEQPIPRGNPFDLAKLRTEVPIPIMVDESLVTVRDAEQLIEAGACDFFNLRISKCGGISKTLQLAKLAEKSGIRLQLGAHVGETAILTAVGRHVAAYLEHLAYVEGSYGTMLLSEDIGAENVNFGRGGEAPVLQGPGLGVSINEGALRKYAIQTVQCGKTTP